MNFSSRSSGEAVSKPGLSLGGVRSAVLVAVVSALFVGVAASGSARAAVTYPFSSSFGSYSNPGSVAVNEATGAVLVVEKGTGRIHQVDASGAPLPFTAPELAGATALDGSTTPEGSFNPFAAMDVAVDNSGTATQGSIYVVANSFVYAFDATGHYRYALPSFRFTFGPNGVGVAPDGSVWGVDGGAYVREFTAGGVATGRSIVLVSNGVNAIHPAFDGSGNVFVNFELGGASRYDIASAAFENTVDPDGPAYAVDVDSATDTVFVDHGDEIVQFSAAGVRQAASGRGTLGDSRGLAFNSASGMLYASDAATGTVSIFGPALRLPTTGAVADVAPTTATLRAAVDPNGMATSYRFAYGKTTAYGSYAPATPVDAGSGSVDVPVSVGVTGLEPQTRYHFRVEATVGGAFVFGDDQTLKTTGPLATFGSVSGLTPTSATLHGTVDVRGLPDGTFHFQVEALNSGYAVTTADAAVPAGTGAMPVQAAIDGLPADGSFVVQIVTSAGGVSSASELGTFRTPARPAHVWPPPPDISARPFGCTAPVLQAIDGRPKPGAAVSVVGSDLGVGGSVTVGSSRAVTTAWSSTGLTFRVPDGAQGTLPVTIDCGRRSNTVGLVVFAEPDNAFTIAKATVRGTTATLSVRVPGTGKIATAGRNTAAAKVTVKRAGTVGIAVRLSSAGKRALRSARGHRLKVPVRVTYTPAGGTAKTATETVTFTQKMGA